VGSIRLILCTSRRAATGAVDMERASSICGNDLPKLTNSTSISQESVRGDSCSTARNNSTPFAAMIASG
jgi:hypothetical protein